MPKIFDRPEKYSGFLPGSQVEIPGGEICRVLGYSKDGMRVFDGHQIRLVVSDECRGADESQAPIPHSRVSNRRKAEIRKER